MPRKTKSSPSPDAAIPNPRSPKVPRARSSDFTFPVPGDGGGPLVPWSHSPPGDGGGVLVPWLSHLPGDGGGVPVPWLSRPSRRGFGYLPDVPDYRDHDIGLRSQPARYRNQLGRFLAAKPKDALDSHFNWSHLKAAAEYQDAIDGVKSTSGSSLAAKPPKAPGSPAHVNLGDTGCVAAVENQGPLFSCSAHAVLGMAEYLIKAGTGTTVDLSRLFLYKEARSQMQVRGDTGAYIRNTIQALATMGSPPEREWPYDIRLFDVEPTGRLYAYAANFKAVEYKRIDTYNNDPEDSLLLAQLVLAAGFPLVLGFPVYTSIEEVTAEQWVIPIPGWSQETAQKIDHDQLSGGHAVLVVGYDKNIPVKGPAGTTQGAFIIRNSWGEQWGDQGFAYLPFHYVVRELAVDLWTIFSNSWINEKVFH